MKRSNETNLISIGDWSFHNIKLEDMEHFHQFIQQTEYPANVWSSNFAYLLASSQAGNRKVAWKEIENLIVPFHYNSYHRIISPICLPLGKGDVEHIVDVLYKSLVYCYQYNLLNKNEKYTKVRTINESQLQFLQTSPRFEQLFRLKKLSGIERHYHIHKILQLSGKDFAYVRRKLNKFYRSYPQAIIRKYKVEDYDQLMSLNQIWEKQKNTAIDDRTYYREILKHAEDLDHLLLVVEIDNQIIGMTSGGCLPTGQSWTCLRKGDHTIEGLSEVLLYELVKESYLENPSIQYMNDGSDLADEGLRFFKERFRPELNLFRYRVFLKNPDMFKS